MTSPEHSACDTGNIVLLCAGHHLYTFKATHDSLLKYRIQSHRLRGSVERLGFPAFPLAVQGTNH
jgi:hypothetical protein